MNTKLEKERLFHNQRFGGDDSARGSLAGYYSINKFSNAYFNKQILDICQGAELLEYGCGTGETAFRWAKNGARVTGIDLSDEGINKARENANKQQLDVSFYQMNAEDIHYFQSHSFDVVTGVGILHHLDLDKAYSELARVLRRDGQALFIEPLGHNLIINLYRRLTPTLRTEDEHPLMMKDIEAARKYFGEVRVRYFHIFTLLAVPFRRLAFFDHLLRALEAVDRSLMHVLPFAQRYAWQVVITFCDPLQPS